MSTDFETCPRGTTAELLRLRLRVANLECSLDDVIKQAVNRFLAWRLPPDFAPGAGISFNPPGRERMLLWPTGTDLFDATQARAMFDHCLGDSPTAVTDATTTHAGIDLCEVAAAVEVVRAVEIVKEVAGVVANLHEGPFRHGFEAACEEIEHRLRPCEHCEAAAKAGA